MLASCVAVILALCLFVHHWKARHRRQMATQIIRRLEEALAGRGHVISFRWLAETQFEAALRFANSGFRRASILVEFSDSKLTLLPWLWRSSQEYEPVMPVIFTTACDWSPELAATVVTSRANQQQQFQNVQFRRRSPNFSASMPLHIFSEGENHLEFFTALRDLATEVTTSAK